MNKRTVQFEIIAFFLLALLWALVGFGAERNANWRLFRLPDSAAASVSISPRGKVLMKSGETGAIHWMDGFEKGQYPGLSPNSFRVYESRSGQLWSLYQDGLMLYDRGSWTAFPIPEIRNELRANPLWQLRQIALIPAELNRVFFLLPDKLYEFETGKQTVLLKSVDDTGLERFVEMHETAGGDIWVSGINGLARIPGPSRRVTPQTQWQEFLFQSDQRFAFQRPFEKEGVVTTVAVPLEQSGPRLLVQLKEGQWKTLEAGLEKIRAAWQGWDNQVWALTFSSLLRANMDEDQKLTREAIASIGTQYDVAVEPNGAFWVATSEGLVRYASSLWRSAPGFEKFDGPVYGFLVDRKQPGLRWFLTTDGLVKANGDLFKHYPWPEDFNTAMQGADSIYQMGDGKLVIAAGYKPMIFDWEKETFHFLRNGTNEMRVLGQTPKGDLITRTFSPGFEVNHIEVFDGVTNQPAMMAPPEWAGSDINFAYMATSGDLWIGSNQGLAVKREISGKIEVYGPGDGLAPERTFCVAEGPGGKIWVGGSDRVHELQGRHWTPILSGIDRVNSITRDADGTFWVGCFSGLYQYLEGSWIHHGLEEGLPSSIVYELKPNQQGQLMAATSRGVAVLHTEADPDSPKTLPPVVRYPATPSTVEPTTISLEGLDKWDYTARHQLLFATKLDEGPWSPFTNATARVFDKLSSGAHRLEVRAMDRNGNIDPVNSMLEFAVIVPWFQDPRLLAVSILGAVMMVFLGGVAVNRHLQLKKSYAAVEKIVAQRTSELEKANQELLMTEKMRAIGTMSAGIAHDFNNILSIIKGSAQIIEANVEDRDKIKTRVNRINMVVEQGSSIVKAMLGIGRMDEKNLAPCNIADLLEEAIRLVSDRFPEAIRFKVEVPFQMEMVTCSREVLNQMLLNLLLNAADAVGAQGEIIVSARFHHKLPRDLFLEPAPKGPWLELAVRDDGSGISGENLSRIFEPFFTTKALSSRRGTGLGLSMVYELAKGMNYGLRVESKPKEGSRFSIFVPRAPAPMMKSQTDKIPASMSG
ncbi:MAG: ATP-binding protein [Verrucomicrobiales bacterium]